jgi:hypothetical protein
LPSPYPTLTESPEENAQPIEHAKRSFANFRLGGSRQLATVSGRDSIQHPSLVTVCNPEGRHFGNHGTVPAIARRIYDERASHDMPIVADALEDAGCTDADLLAHCRAGGPHVRGCWAVDLLLGKM